MNVAPPSSAPELRQRLQPALTTQEELLWVGQPKPYKIAPIEYLGMGIVLVLIMALFSSVSFAVIPVVLFLFYITIMRVAVEKYLRPQITYGITNRHILLHTALNPTPIEIFDIQTIANLSMEVGADGSGTIIIGDTTKARAFSLRATSIFPTYVPPALEKIADVRTVYALIQELRH